MKEKEYKTPAYTRKAISNYREKNRAIQFFVPVEIFERMRAAGIDNSTIKELIIEELERRENGKG